MNNKKIVKQIRLSFIFKVLSFLLYFVCVSLQANLLGDIKYGLWSTLSSIYSFIIFFDFGLGNGIKNELSSSMLSLNNKYAKEIIATSLALSFILALLLFLIIALMNYYLDVNSFFNIKYEIIKDFKLVFLTAIALMLVAFGFSIVRQFFYAIQQNSKNEFEQLIFYTLLTIALCATSKKIEVFLWVSVAYGLTLIISKIIMLIHFFYIKPDLLIKFSDLNSKIIPYLIRVGGSFFLLQIVSMSILLTDRILITHLVSISAVTTYDLLYRYFSVIIIAHSLINAPLWVEYGRAWKQGNFLWIRKTLNKMNFVALGLSGVGLIAYLCAPYILPIWLGHSFHAPNSVILSILCVTLITVLANNYAFFLNGIGYIKFQLFTLLIGAVINVPTSFLFVKKLGMGIEGIVYSTVISLALFVLPVPFYARKILKC